MKERSGTTDQPTDSAVKATSAASAMSGSDPGTGPRRRDRSAPTITAAATATARISAIVVRPSSVPPAATKATAARSAATAPLAT